jgi:hypothetical protein
MMGVTVVYSSGDFGVAGNGGDCLNPDGSQSKDGKIFNRTLLFLLGNPDGYNVNVSLFPWNLSLRHQHWCYADQQRFKRT